MQKVHGEMARIYADGRFPPRGSSLGADLRQFALATVWVIGAERPPAGQRWQRVAEILHMDGWRRFWRTIGQDCPRYESPPLPAECEAPMIRRDGMCGQRAAYHEAVTNPVDGTWRHVGYCRRHEANADAVRDAERRRRKAGGIPDPPPNAGGLLPCYIRWNWPEAYRQARSDWEPPALGICADDWPVLAKVAEMEPPKLRALDGDGEAMPGAHEAPSLRLVRN
jgi:hypothetical protein